MACQNWGVVLALLAELGERMNRHSRKLFFGIRIYCLPVVFNPTVLVLKSQTYIQRRTTAGCCGLILQGSIAEWPQQKEAKVVESQDNHAVWTQRSCVGCFACPPGARSVDRLREETKKCTSVCANRESFFL